MIWVEESIMEDVRGGKSTHKVTTDTRAEALKLFELIGYVKED